MSNKAIKFKVKDKVINVSDEDIKLFKLDRPSIQDTELKSGQVWVNTNFKTDPWRLIQEYDGNWRLGGLHGDLFVLHSDASRDDSLMKAYLSDSDRVLDEDYDKRALLAVLEIEKSEKTKKTEKTKKKNKK